MLFETCLKELKLYICFTTITMKSSNGFNTCEKINENVHEPLLIQRNSLNILQKVKYVQSE